MRWTKISALPLFLLSILLVSSAFAQTMRDRADNREGANLQETGNIYRASKIIGTNVANPQGEALGEIADVVFDPQTGRITYAVLSFGGFLGLGEKHFAIPWTALTPQAGRTTAAQRFILNVDKERLKSAPGFEKTTWPNMADRRWGEQVHAFYGVTPYWQQQEARMPESVPERVSGTDLAIVGATVQNVDQSSRLLKFRTSNDEIIEMQAPSDLLGDLQAGDSIEVTIRKHDMTESPTMRQPSDVPATSGQSTR